MSEYQQRDPKRQHQWTAAVTVHTREIAVHDRCHQHLNLTTHQEHHPYQVETWDHRIGMIFLVRQLILCPVNAKIEQQQQLRKETTTTDQTD